MDNEVLMESLMQEGYEAYNEGLHSEECPYDKASTFALQWLDGWREAYDDALPARESEAEDKRLDSPRHGQAQ